MEKKRESIKLGARLRAISREIIPGLTLADIGSEHALLPLFLLEKQLVPLAIVTELDDGPYQKAEKAVAGSPWGRCIQVRQGDGLQPLNAGEAGNVVIAGLGGDTIAEILSRDWQKAENFGHYVLQPMSRACVLRDVLARRGWTIRRETLSGERGKIYVIISVSPGSAPYFLSPLEMDLGPLVLRGESPWKSLYLQFWRNKYQRVLEGLIKSGHKGREVIIEEYREKIRALEVMTGVD